MEKVRVLSAWSKGEARGTIAATTEGSAWRPASSVQAWESHGADNVFPAHPARSMSAPPNCSGVRFWWVLCHTHLSSPFCHGNHACLFIETSIHLFPVRSVTPRL
ncbi:hypothetical protein FKM82_025620 [Ascaphus truei]